MCSYRVSPLGEEETLGVVLVLHDAFNRISLYSVQRVATFLPISFYQRKNKFMVPAPSLSLFFSLAATSCLSSGEMRSTIIGGFVFGVSFPSFRNDFKADFADWKFDLKGAYSALLRLIRSEREKENMREICLSIQI